MKNIIALLMVESDQNIVEEIINIIRDKYSCQVNKIQLPHQVEKICVSGLEISINELQVKCEGNQVVFNYKEFRLICYLAQHPRQVFTKKQIYEAVWDDIPISVDAKVECMVYSIRKKLRAYTDRQYIQTVWGVGYKFDPRT